MLVPVILHLHNEEYRPYECKLDDSLSNPNGVLVYMGEKTTFFPWSQIQRIDFIKKDPQAPVPHNSPQPPTFHPRTYGYNKEV